MDEFDLIDTMVEILVSTATGTGVAVGPGDDAAVLEIPAGHQLVVSTDTLVAGRHFPADAQADVIGYRSMAVATSDLAAMGATPAYATVALTIEQLPEDWARHRHRPRGKRLPPRRRRRQRRAGAVQHHCHGAWPRPERAGHHAYGRETR